MKDNFLDPLQLLVAKDIKEIDVRAVYPTFHDPLTAENIYINIENILLTLESLNTQYYDCIEHLIRVMLAF